MANSLRSFSVGLIVASVACGVVYYTSSNDQLTDQAEAEAPLTDDEMILQLEDNGYLVRNSEEWEAEVNTVIDTTRQEVEAEFAEVEEEEATEDEPEEEENEEEQEEQEAENESEEVFLLIIRNGMTSFDVADELIRGNIIDNKREFVVQAEQQNLAGFLKPGAYEITSGMTTADIFALIT
ncbi:endolytic transglycosylase MltG [Alkalicoccobacillus plakortidis]|uniref:Endolytic transglycosylase MltG n=1 Tax=Alkalicoccobacillus plakortidis TaxID=444060 RepID=A0ABT0XPH4_9BACI|nr:endolytic transglycosylase MltG [Alkalicoccobacillus plakortidis]MCM2677809.1 endolytic transglycosylase MltG [Alkalicoccobacillus plakortidis]